VEFAVGKTLFVMGHEMGHVVINELELPVLGREEDAADSFAIIMALQLRSEFSERVLMETARGWFLSSYRDRRAKTAPSYYGEHSLDRQRAYHVVCMMVGSDPDRFKALAREAKLPEWRQRSCGRDYRNAVWSWEKALKPHPGVVTIKSVDGIGARSDKLKTWAKLTTGLPPAVHAGFKLFYTEDARHGPLMTPAQVMALKPRPELVIYE